MQLCKHRPIKLTVESTKTGPAPYRTIVHARPLNLVEYAWHRFRRLFDKDPGYDTTISPRPPKELTLRMRAQHWSTLTGSASDALMPNTEYRAGVIPRLSFVDSDKEDVCV